MDSIEEGQRFLAHDKKWLKFLRLARGFRHIPFVDIVFGTGSMVIGNITENSDFDVLIRTKRGRIFTARFGCVLFFGLKRARRRPGAKKTKDKVCLSHFFTKEVRVPGLPYDKVREILPDYIVPIYGEKDEIDGFLKELSRDREKKRRFEDDLRYLGAERSRLKIWLERILAGRAGDLLEKFLKYTQKKKVERSLKGKELVDNALVRVIDKEICFLQVKENKD